MWHAPGTLEELRSILAGRPRGQPLVATGAASPPAKLSRIAPDCCVVSTSRLSGIVEHRRDDLTVTVRAGSRMGDLLDAVSRGDQWIPVVDRATQLSVGGVVSSAPPGAFDATLGPVRRQLLGVRAVAPNGREYRWGRAVMKNVAGYDVPRLFCGSFGRLGVIAEATFRLWPRPTAWLGRTARGEGAADLARRVADAEGRVAADGVVWSLARAQIEPAGTAASGESLTLWLVGSERSVASRAAALAETAARCGCQLEDAPSTDLGPERNSRRTDRCALRIAPRAGDLWDLPGRLVAALGRHLELIDIFPAAGIARVEYERGRGEVEEVLGELSEACRDSRLAVERGGPEEQRWSQVRRPAAVRELEERVVAAMEGQPRPWQADYL